MTAVVQVPAALAHDRQAPQDGDPQQRPSTQFPFEHSLPAEQTCPWAFLQAPAPSQLLVPVQVSGSLAFKTLVQVPAVVSGFEPEALQASQVPHALDTQHTPSTQKPVSQVVPTEQLSPRT